MDKRPGRGSGSTRGTGGRGGGAIPKVRTEPPSNQRWRGPPDSSRGMSDRIRGFNRAGPQRQQSQHFNHRLNFDVLCKLASDKIEPSDIIRCLGNPDLASFLEENGRNVEYLELIVVALGEFCKKNGTSQFTESFLTVVKILAEQKSFTSGQITSMILNITTSMATNMPTRPKRLKRLTNAVYHVATEILVLMPAFACEFLGQNFFTDLLPLEMIPSIKNLNVPDAFQELKEGVPLLETAWSQHIPKNKKEESRNNKQQYLEELSLQDPPDNFRTLNITPKWEDVCVDVEPFLRPNIVKGAYPDVGSYLDIQFRLLREDFFYPLRIGLLAYKDQVDRKYYARRNNNVRLYYDVQICAYDMTREMTMIYFPSPQMKKINWESSKRFMFGSLLLLSSDNFNTFLLCTVADRNPKELAEGRLKVKFEDGMIAAHVKKQTFVVAESTVFFESYRGVLQALQRISPANFPLKEYILGQKSTAERPKYLEEEEEPLYDLSCMIADLQQVLPKTRIGFRRAIPLQVDVLDDKVRRLLQVAIFDPNNRPSGDVLNLDPSQTAALYAALTQKVSVIQGPPGTGKTYLGLRIVHTLLQNSKFWTEDGRRKSPILVICYTNHALDQFLEGITKFTRNIVRVGSFSKCAALESFSLVAWKKDGGIRAAIDTRRWIFEIHEKLRQLSKERDIISSDLVLMESCGLIHEESLLEMKIISQSVYQKFFDLKNMMSVNNYPDHYTALGLWLQIYNNQDLDRVVGFFNGKGLAKKQLATIPQRTAKEETEAADDEWDKDHIDEIQGQRKFDEDEDYLAVLEETKKNRKDETDEVLGNRVSVNFAFKLSFIEKRIDELKISLGKFEKEDAKWMEREIEWLKTNFNILYQLLKNVPAGDEKLLNDCYKRDLFQIPLPQRWMMYSAWKKEALHIQEKRASDIERLFRENTAKLKDVRDLESAEICQNADVVGFTTTGAAKNRALLNHLKPKIVIVEEAAEVLEAHVVCALSSTCEQLILIGDHQQLRPPVTVYKLAKDFSLDVSLFERLIKNGMEPCVLGVQHRMRPEIAKLIVPSIYPTLENHPSVLDYPVVRGMSSNVFFLSHNEHEVADHEGKSHLNPYEAELALALARHLVMQGYEPSQITILTTYSGQLLHFFKLRRSQSAVQSVRISVVDNFQGEENDIIILSLVRSNDDENIGFLRIENRICVALSRAKHGFYMIGNMQNLQGRSSLWNGISETLSSSGQLGPDFGLKCEVHGSVMKVRKVSDFPPEGGCVEKCAAKIDCGHTCPKMCHASDRDHTQFNCFENCNRLCPVGHPCPEKCFKRCPPCLVSVTKTLPCLHEQVVRCHSDPEKEFCKTMVWKILPICEHGKDLACGASPAEAKCSELCGMKIRCGHICPLICHIKTSHSEIKCEQSCLRKCLEKHPCNKKCHEDCGHCLTITKKLLPCGHEADVECFKNPKDVYCKVKVEKVLSNCQHVIEIDCGKPIDGIKCMKPCEKLLCGDGHHCKKLCFEPCGRCFVRIVRKLECGHETTRECFVDPLKIKCKVPKECDLPACGHRATIKCGEDPTEANCPLPCDTRLDCGHTCTMNCHVKIDPDHENYICKKPCGKMKRGCKMEHKCGKKCNEDCDLCNAKWKRTLPCGHTIYTECHRDDEDIFCPILVTKTISECGHHVKLACSTEATRALCQEACVSILSCGHLCKKKCREPCNSADCDEMVKTSHANVCGHTVTVNCKTNQQAGGMLKESDKALHLTNCLEPCGAVLDCTHLCKGTCGGCLNGRVHRACGEHCGRSLVCGHICNVNCGLSCPPCVRKCEYSCKHSKCRKNCCEPCSPCKELCEWKCEHKACTKNCGEPCNRTRCDEPCKKILPCGHSCVGLCGEICPPLCRICDKEKLTELLFGNEDDDDAKFIFLPECTHCIEVEGLDQWMTSEGNGQIQPKCCPKCKTTIRTCLRYGEIIKGVYGDIARVKQKMLSMRGNPIEFFKKTCVQFSTCNRLLDKVNQLNPQKNSLVEAIRDKLFAVHQQLAGKKKNGKIVNPSIGPDQRFQIQVNFDFLVRALKLVEKVLRDQTTTKKSELAIRAGDHTRNSPAKYPATPMKPELASEFNRIIHKLLRSAIDRERISLEEAQAVGRELDRLDLVRAFYVLQSHESYATNGMNTFEKELIERLLTKNIRVLVEDEKHQIKTALKLLSDKLRTGLGISDKERQEIVSALSVKGITRGHWFKCPNGHIYAIGDCGGAMVESRCNECHAIIGGTEHRLHASNTLAGEMDGAIRPAWPR